MKNKEYIINELLKAIQNIENDIGTENGELLQYFENTLNEIEKNF